MQILPQFRFTQISVVFALLGTLHVGGKDLPALKVTPPGIPNHGMLFVSHEAQGRSGHGNQALVQCRNGDIIAFYSNTSGEIMAGHSNSGWTEYRISTDRGALGRRRKCSRFRVRRAVIRN